MCLNSTTNSAARVKSIVMGYNQFSFETLVKPPGKIYVYSNQKLVVRFDDLVAVNDRTCFLEKW